MEKTGSSDYKIRLLNISNNKPQQNLKIINNEKNKIQNLSLTNNKTLQRLKFVKFYLKKKRNINSFNYFYNRNVFCRNKKTLTKQLCLIFNRFGVCSKLDQGECDKRHYKKYVTLCTKLANFNSNVLLN